MIKIEASMWETTFIDFLTIERKLRKEQLRVVSKYADRAVDLYQGVSNQFTPKNRPTYRTHSAKGRSPVDGADAIFGVGGVVERDTPMTWLGVGTKVRYRVMSRNFKSRTIPGGGLFTRTPKGGGVSWGKRPGIKPRKFTDDVIRKTRRDFEREVKDVLQVFFSSRRARTRKIV